jgi:hypothetical protein
MGAANSGGFSEVCYISSIYKDDELVKKYSTCENKAHDFQFAETQVKKLEKDGICVYAN